MSRRRPIRASSQAKGARRPENRVGSTSAGGIGRNEPLLYDELPAGPGLRERSRLAWQRLADSRTGRWGGRLVALALLVGLILGVQHLTRAGRGLDAAEVDQLIEQALQTKPIPSFATAAYEAIRPSVVRVMGGETKEDADERGSVGSGVVIVDSGLILTNLHVVSGAKKIVVVFADGTESEARLVNAQPDNDLAVIQATTLPDDLVAAKLGSTRELQVGDHVMAVGFPFGIGPSASGGIVSGLKRSNESQGDASKSLSNLIQFDAAANPGNSGGPLVTANGEVVGIVTGILNPTRQRVFIGIGFAVPIESAAAAAGMPPF